MFSYAGDVQLQGQTISFQDGSAIRANTLSSGQGSQSSPQSNLTASSGLGIEATGEIVVNNLAIDPAQTVTELPQTVATEPKIQAVCSPDEDIASHFTHSSRGGIPPAATPPLKTVSLWQDSSGEQARNPEPIQLEAIEDVRVLHQPEPAIVEPRA